MASAPKKQQQETIEIVAVARDTVKFAIVGTAPLILNRVPEKVRQQLFIGAGKKTAAEKAGTAKHDPLEEFRSAAYRMLDAKAETLLGFPASAFKAAMETAALETPGAKKAQVGRLVTMPWGNVAIFGVPQIFCCITRSADIAKTPDVRTRAILPEWAAELDVSFVTPTLRAPMIATLLANAGIVSGIGDWRQEKGAGSFGTFRVAGQDDKDFIRIKENGGRAVQEAAMQDPLPFDADTEELLTWFNLEISRRGLRRAA